MNSDAPFTPESILPDGVDVSTSINPYTQESGKVRKGTVAAMLNNVAKLNLLLVKEDGRKVAEEVQALIQAIDELIPSLQIIGMFDLFEPSLWIGRGEQLGRAAVVLLYFKQYPDKWTPELKQHVLSLKNVALSSHLKRYIEALTH